MGDRPRRSTQAHASSKTLHLPPHILQRVLCLVEQAPRVLEKRFPDRRGAHLCPFSQKQRRADTLFQLRDMQTDRGRGEMELAGGFSERAAIGNGNKRTQSVVFKN